MTMDASLNVQTQTAQFEQSYVNEASSGTVATGQLDSQTIQASSDVDASTKDDEVMSSFQAEDSKKVNEQDHRSKRISKQVENRLNVINNTTNQDLQSTIEKRSDSLFSGSEQKYSECFDSLDKAHMKQGLNSNDIEDALKKFNDVAEQHNALQIIKDVWERKLSNLKKLAQEVKSPEKNDNDEKSFNNQDYGQLQKQIEQLENSLDVLSDSQDKIMLTHGNRIEDSYKLAPLLRETTAHFTHDITLPPKDFNALLLDKILPLKGDILQTFDCLTQGFIENLSKNDTGRNAIGHFKDNISIIKKCLNNELKCCPDPQIASAVLNACRSAEKLESIHELHEQNLFLTYSTFGKIGN